MKNTRKAACGIMLTFLALSVCACGNQTSRGEVKPFASDASDSIVDGKYNAADYVTLGDYMGMQITLDGYYDVTEGDVDDYIDTLIGYYGVYAKSDETIVTDTSIVNVDYTGYQDNQPFDRGAASDQNVDIANSGYIPGFAEALIGHSVGDNFRADMTFPDTYSDEKMAGQDVQFEFTINYICKKITASELTDEIVSTYFDMGTVDSFRGQIRAELESNAASSLETDERSAVMTKLYEVCTVDIPDSLLIERTDEAVDIYKKTNLAEGQLIEDYLEQYYDITYDEFYDQQMSAASEDLSIELICEAIAQAEGIEVTDEDYNTFIDGIMSYNTSFSTVDELYESYRGTVEAGEKYFRKIFLCNNVITYLVDNADITVK